MLQSFAMLTDQRRPAFPCAGMLTLDGRCKSLDASADGYVRAENCTAFLLAAADPAVQPETATVVVRGSAVNQDGRSSSLTAPNGPAQQSAVRAALSSGDLAAASVGLLEMHGTGTPLGDPIEVGAAVAVLQGIGRMRPLAFTAIKSRLGHAETGAGVLGMLHVWRQLSQATSHSITHLRTVNPYVDSSLESSSIPTHVSRQAAPSVMPARDADELCAGVSSFAFQVRLASGVLRGSQAVAPSLPPPNPASPLPSNCREPTRTWCSARLAARSMRSRPSFWRPQRLGSVSASGQGLWRISC